MKCIKILDVKRNRYGQYIFNILTHDAPNGYSFDWKVMSPYYFNAYTQTMYYDPDRITDNEAKKIMIKKILSELDNMISEINKDKEMLKKMLNELE